MGVARFNGVLHTPPDSISLSVAARRGEIGCIRFQELTSQSIAIKVRVAVNLVTDHLERWQQMQATFRAALPFSMRYKRSPWPAFWKQRPFVANLVDV